MGCSLDVWTASNVLAERRSCMLQVQELRCASEFVSEFAVGKLLAAQKKEPIGVSWLLQAGWSFLVVH